MTLLTVWYWFYTDPGRRRASERPQPELLDDPADPVPGVPSARPEGSAQAVEAPFLGGPVAGVAPASIGSGAVAGAGAEPNLESDHGGEPTEGRGPADDRDDEDFVTGPILARQTWDFVAAAKRAEGDRTRAQRSTRPASPRIAVPDRSAPAPVDEEADELAVVRRRRERQAARGLSDELWESVRRSVFDKLDS